MSSEPLLTARGLVKRYGRVTALDNADLTYGRVRDESGNEIELTKARQALLLRSKDRATRQRAYEAFTKAYLENLSK